MKEQTRLLLESAKLCKQLYPKQETRNLIATDIRKTKITNPEQARSQQVFLIPLRRHLLGIQYDQSQY